jgi:protein-L-isoaspartate(D-aspartate) O-methyltransferase
MNGRAAPHTLKMQRMLEHVRAAAVADANVLAAMSQVPRHLFLTPALAAEAYDDAALPIGERQTISRPSVVGQMTQALGDLAGKKVLEIGTGCGYQTAVLCKLARRVVTIERHASLSQGAAQRLQAMGVSNFVPIVGDGTMGWKKLEPFDAIIVTAAGPRIPESLVAQLAVGGVLVIPVGMQEEQQRLVRVTKKEGGKTHEEVLGLVSFVPLVGREGAAATLLGGAGYALAGRK